MCDHFSISRLFCSYGVLCLREKVVEKKTCPFKKMNWIEGHLNAKQSQFLPNLNFEIRYHQNQWKRNTIETVSYVRKGKYRNDKSQLISLSISTQYCNSVCLKCGQGNSTDTVKNDAKWCFASVLLEQIKISCYTEYKAFKPVTNLQYKVWIWGWKKVAWLHFKHIINKWA